VKPVWRPPPELLAESNVARFMAAHGIHDVAELRRRSVADPVWCWDAVVRHLGIQWAETYDTVLDLSAGVPWARWFVGGRLNVASHCVDRHPPDRVALRWEGEDGEARVWSYGELRAHADGLAALLTDRGVRAGDVVGMLLPMLPEMVATVFGLAKLGAVCLPLFSGYGAAAVAARLGEARAVALVTADGCLRRGKVVELASTAAAAAASTPTLHTTVVVPRLGRRPASDARTVPWPGPGPTRPTPAVDSEHPLFLAYTSGTTGRPKAAVHVHAGWLVQIAQQVAFQLDCRADDTLQWFSDPGWIMGPVQLTGTLAAGATLALYEGAPDHPGPDRLWAFAARHRVSILGLSPTLVRTLMGSGDGPVRAHDRSALRILASTGEPWNDEPWRWYFETVGERRCPVINLSGGTEVGGAFLSPYPVEPIAPTSLGGPALGMAVDVVDAYGRPVRGAVGELVCRAPWPSMTRGLFGDPERYLSTYWGRWTGVWVHGDWALIDEHDDWFLLGRSDDTIQVAGKRLGPAEVESVLVAHPDVAEAAAVGVPDARQGEALWVFAVPAPGVTPDEALRAELVALVAVRLGAAFRPAAVRFVTALPKTRNAKVVRRAVRAAVTGDDAGDLSALEDPGTLDAVRAAS
jgi:acetyl-CoA synthetase